VATATEAIQAGAIAVAEVIIMDGVEAIIAIDENPHCLRVIILEEAASVWRLFLCCNSHLAMSVPGTQVRGRDAHC
jgi:hypothetical protein